MKTNVKMSSLVDNTTYTGKDALAFYSKALLEGDTKSMISLVPDVKSKVKLPRLDLAGILQTSDCTFTPAGTATLSQKTLEVCPIKINLEFCTRDFEVNFLSEQLRPGSSEAQMPNSFQDYILDEIGKTISAELERLLWQGNTAASPADICNGLLTKMSADLSVIAVTGTTLSAANIIAEIGKVYNAIPNTIINRGKVVIFVSPTAAKFYKQALAALNNSLLGSYNNGDFTLSYIDVPVVVAPGMSTNEMVAAEPKNLWYGTDLVTDIEDILIIPQRDKTGAPTVRVVAEFKFGVNYGISEEVVFYN
jgi:hypothetical protein